MLQDYPTSAALTGSLNPVSIRRYNRVLELVLNKAPLKAILTELCQLIEHAKPDTLASVLLLSDDGKRLQAGAAPHLPEHYSQAIDGALIGDQAGSCGTAAYRGERVIVEDIDTHPYWKDYRELAASAGLRACWSEPILDGQHRLIGTFAMYYRVPRTPEPEDLAIILEAARLASLAIERSRASQQERLTALIVDHLAYGLIVTDADLNILSVNPAYTRITGYSAEESLGQCVLMLLPNAHDRHDLSLALPEVEDGHGWKGEIAGRHKNGDPCVLELTVSVLRDAHGEPERYIALFNDISERKRAEDLIHYQANYDLLTGLPNRNLLYDRLAWCIYQARRDNRRFGLMLMDLDYFKEVNDTHGHDRGDELLIQVAHRLRQHVRASDTLARLGGDEFALVIPHVQDADTLARIARQLLNTLSTTFQLQGGIECRISTSLGIAIYPDDGQSIEQLVKSADQAMYAAKQAGRSAFVQFNEHIRQAAEEQAALHRDLRTAIEADQLRVYYQPIVDPLSGQVAKAEALVRWLHPQRGFVPPEHFIPIAEKTDLIRQLGQWVREQAFRQVAQWHRAGHRLRLAVNVSTVEFHQAELANTLLATLDASGLPATQLTVEVTESLLMRNPADVMAALSGLRGRGIRIAIDDFGTGYSSLSYLASFPIDELKIDRSFVSGFSQDPTKQTLVDAMISLGHSLGLTVVAEGVENSEEWQALVDRGCDYVQGYALGRPLCAEDFETQVLAAEAARQR